MLKMFYVEISVCPEIITYRLPEKGVRTIQAVVSHEHHSNFAVTLELRIEHHSWSIAQIYEYAETYRMM